MKLKDFIDHQNTKYSLTSTAFPICDSCSFTLPITLEIVHAKSRMPYRQFLL